MQPDHCGRIDPTLSRRQLLQRAGGGIGALALSAMLRDEGLAASVDLGVNPMRARMPHSFGRAKRVIWLFINGGPSHIDTWDYKPGLEKALHHRSSQVRLEMNSEFISGLT